MIDVRTSLVMAMHANFGVYAVLLGSGVSRAANIPTGWEIVGDMIKRMAAANKEAVTPDAETWYKHKFGALPTYSALLEAVGKSQAERSRLLKAYFEPSGKELERGDKQPTRAHSAIARLVKKGIVRVVLTTNFDRLVERALEAEGVAPTVISTPESIDGAYPMVHSDCTLIKLHGDYMDLRTKNTQPELNAYDPRLDALLDRVFDEYGLIVCGWSGEWDEALRKAMERRKGRRFSTWWTSMGRLSDNGKRLVAFCHAELVPIQNADEFFEDVSEKLDALEQFDQPHPASTKMAVTLTKKYVSESKHRIQMNDLLMREVERIIQELNSRKYPLSGTFCKADYAKRILLFDALSQIAMHVLATGCFWNTRAEYLDIWIRAIQRLANPEKDSEVGNATMRALVRHPARLLLYSAGIALAARRNYDAIFMFLNRIKVKKYNEEEPLIISLTSGAWDTGFKAIPELKRSRIPVSEHCFSVLKPVFAQILPDHADFTHNFDLFEILSSLYLVEAFEGCPLPGAFLCRSKKNSAFMHLADEVSEKKDISAPLMAGFCNGEFQKFEEIYQTLQKQLLSY